MGMVKPWKTSHLISSPEDDKHIASHFEEQILSLALYLYFINVSNNKTRSITSTLLSQLYVYLWIKVLLRCSSVVEKAGLEG